MSVTATEARRRHQAERRTRLPAGEPRPRTGPADTLSAAEAFDLVCELPVVAGTPSSRRNQRLWGIPLILAWLEQHPGEGWQERWLAAGADQGTGWLDDIVADDPRKPGNKRTTMTYAVAFLLLARVILPGYEFLAAYRSRELFKWVREQHRPDLFARLEQAGTELGMQAPHVHDAVKAITRIVLHTGRPDPAARSRLVEIIKNLADRIAEARINGWLGEVEGLQVSLTAARGKLTALDRTARNAIPGTADLGMPAFHQESPDMENPRHDR